MGKGNRGNQWSSLFNDELGETSYGNARNPRRYPRDPNGEDNGRGSDEEIDAEEKQIQEILHLHNADHPGMQLVGVHLTGNNFLNWSRSIKRALGAKSKLEILDRTLAEPESNSKYYKQWVKVDYMVSSWITNSISKDLVNSFSHYDTTKKLWDALVRRFDRSNGPKIAKLEKEIRAYCQGNQTVLEYFNNLNVLWNEMDMVLPPVDCSCQARIVLDKREEDRRLVQFLLGLNECYEHSRSQILLLEPLPSVDKAYSMITQVEDEKSMQEGYVEGRGHMTMFTQRQGGNGNNNQGQRYRGTYEKGGYGDRRLSKEEKQKLRCSHYKENGHEVHECFKLYGYPEWYKRYKDSRGKMHVNYVDDGQEDDNSSRSGERYEGRYQNEGGGSHTQMDVGSIVQAEIAKYLSTMGSNGGNNHVQKADVNMVSEEKNVAGLYDGHYAFSIVPSMERTIWIVDSGASAHVCCDREMLHTTYWLDKAVIVHLPDGSTKRVTVTGRVKLSADIVLYDVLFVPGFTHNLISVAQLIKDSGVRCVFLPTHCVFERMADNKTIGTGNMERNLYVFQIVVENHFTHLFRTEEMSLQDWHNFLGHPSLSTLRHMPHLSERFVEDQIQAIQQCEVCMKAKLTREPFPVLNRRSQCLFVLVHADIWGPYSEESVSNTRFVLTIVEDHSRSIWTYLLSSKELVCSVFKSFIIMVRTHFKRDIKFIRTDNGSEFINKKMQDLFQECGILHQRSCVYTPQQNGVVERRHRTLLEAARSLMFQSSVPLKFCPY